VLVVDAVLGIEILSTYPHPFRDIVSHPAMKGLNPIPAWMGREVDRPGVEVVRVHGSLFSIHLGSDNHLLANKMVHVSKSSVIRGPTFRPGQVIGSGILHPIGKLPQDSLEDFLNRLILE
jgi:hypothetical protein